MILPRTGTGTRTTRTAPMAGRLRLSHRRGATDAHSTVSLSAT